MTKKKRPAEDAKKEVVAMGDDPPTTETEAASPTNLKLKTGNITEGEGAITGSEVGFASNARNTGKGGAPPDAPTMMQLGASMAEDLKRKQDAFDKANESERVLLDCFPFLPEDNGPIVETYEKLAALTSQKVHDCKVALENAKEAELRFKAYLVKSKLNLN